MSCCANTVQANQQSYFFALSGGAGGGSTLQSPASVTPDVTGTATLAVNANLPGGSAAVAVNGGATSSGAITVGGFGTTYRMGVLSAGALAPSLPKLQIGLNAAVAPAILYDGGDHSLTLGDGDPTSAVATNGTLVVRDAAGGGNSILIGVDTATTSFINNLATTTLGVESSVTIGSSSTVTENIVIADAGTNTAQVVIGGNSGLGIRFQGGVAAGAATIYGNVANSGTMTIGSSAACPNNITVSDTGANTAKVIVGGNSGQSLLLQGGVGSAPATIQSNVAGAGAVLLGSSTISPDNITMSDGGSVGSGRTVVKNLAPPSLANNICSINAQQAVIPVGVNLITLPVGVTATPGLWYFAINVTSGSNPQFQASCIVYYSGTQWSSGGSAQSATDGNGNYTQLYPANDGLNMTVAFGGASALNGYVVVTPLFNAPIIGFG